ncbi:hypothetical protein BDZ45DRAFT_691881 [Acephala macrosclerotiorum]|nr:hypothetical protein BDZ45DRAFT_691881 [Acephala macrosclerotiorum]
MQSIILSFQARTLFACLAILFTIVNSSPISFPIVDSRQAPGLIIAAFFDVNQNLITEFEVGIALQQDLTQITNTLDGQDVFFMNVGNANDLIEVSVCANGIQSKVDFDAFDDACGNIGGLPCPLTQSGVITTISVAGPGSMFRSLYQLRYSADSEPYYKYTEFQGYGGINYRKEKKPTLRTLLPPFDHQ